MQSQVGSLTAAVNQKMNAEVTSEGTAKASYTLNLGIIRNGVKYNTGFGMSIEPSGGSYKSTVVFAADQFGIYSGSDPGNYQAAFFVFNGGIYSRRDDPDGSITNAKIGSYIRSTNFAAGFRGWNIDKTAIVSFMESSTQTAVILPSTGPITRSSSTTTVLQSISGGGRIVVGSW